MRPRWDYRSVEGALYGLARPTGSRPAESRPLSQPAIPRDASWSPVRDTRARTDLAHSLRRTLDSDELEVVKQHYIMGGQRLGGRDGYRRREQIIKKLVIDLNDETS